MADLAPSTGRRSTWAFLALSIALVGCGTPAATNLTVTTQSFRYDPGSLEWRVGQPVKLRLRNPDAVEHDFVVDGMKYSMASGDDGHGAHSGAGAGATAAAPTPHPNSLHVHAASFAETTVTVTPLAKGTYTVYCTIPGHKEAGMTARLVVGKA